MQAGSLETLVDQIRAFAARAKDAGNELTFSEYPDMVHVWHLLRAMTPEGGRAIDEAGTFIRAHTAGAARAARGAPHFVQGGASGLVERNGVIDLDRILRLETPVILL